MFKGDNNLREDVSNSPLAFDLKINDSLFGKDDPY